MLAIIWSKYARADSALIGVISPMDSQYPSRQAAMIAAKVSRGTRTVSTTT